MLAWPAEANGQVVPPTRPAAPLPARAPTPPGGRPPEIGGGLRESSNGLAWLWQLLGPTPAAREQWAELLRLAATSAETPVRAETLNEVGSFACASGDPVTAHAFYQEALIAGRAGQNAASVVRSLTGLAHISIDYGALDLARTYLEEALQRQRWLRDTTGVARTLAVLGWLLFESRGADHAEALHEESLSLRVTLDEPLGVAYSLVHLGWLAHLTGRQDMARQHLAEALNAVRACSERWKVVALLALLGRPTPTESTARRAILLLAGAEALQAVPALQHDNLVDSAACLVEARDRLDARSLATAWSGGRPTDTEELVAQALRACPPNRRTNHHTAIGAAEPMPLTPRELEVATLISRGLTNRKIADQLVITERTAETHARNIREKLGLATRAQIAAWGASRGLLNQQD
jgi:DNA-binding NarL/FixJ family response regulator